jgi:hypothetical protein
VVVLRYTDVHVERDDDEDDEGDDLNRSEREASFESNSLQSIECNKVELIARCTCPEERNAVFMERGCGIDDYTRVSELKQTLIDATQGESLLKE